MKLKNKKTGEILVIGNIIVENTKRIDCGALTKCSSLAELNEEWEDYEEPKKYWFIDETGRVDDYLNDDGDYYENMELIGNVFETKEEAEKAVEKLKAWKRLKDAGCRVTEYKTYGGTSSKGDFIGEVKILLDVPDEIDKELFILLFGGE